MKNQFYKLLLLSFIICSVIAYSFGQDIKVVKAEVAYSKTITGNWLLDSLKTELRQREITIKNINIKSKKTSVDKFAEILKSYIHDYGYFSGDATTKFEFIDGGAGKMLFYSIKNVEDLPRTLKYYIFNQGERYYFLLFTDLEDRNEDIRLLFNLNNLSLNTKTIVLEEEELGEFSFNKK